MWEGGHTVRRPRAPAGRGSGLYVCSLVHFYEGAACSTLLWVKPGLLYSLLT